MPAIAKPFYLLLTICLLAATTSQAQLKIGNNPTTINAASLLEMESTNKGMVLPRVSLTALATAAPLDATLLNGTIVYNTNTVLPGGVGIYIWVAASGWQKLALAANAGSTLNQAYNFGGAGIGRSITANTGAVKIDGTDGLLVTGSQGSGADIEVSGTGARLFFNPRKAAFRAGVVFGNVWDRDSVGTASVAMGWDTKATGSYSFATGSYTQASNLSSVAMGMFTKATGMASFASGSYAQATGLYAAAMGNNSIASGLSAFASGEYVQAKSYGGATFGAYNDITDAPNPSTAAATDRLFQLGNGSNSTRSNAITILRNGNTGIGVLAPQQKLEIDGQIKIMGGSPGTGKVLTSNVDGVASWEPPAAGITGVSLNQAYNFGGAGIGRTITANTGAVKIEGTDGLLVTGTYGSGANIEASGAGPRLFFNPKRAAFRAGWVNGSQWDNDNVGDFSVALGVNAIASESASIALGMDTRSLGTYSFAAGSNATASGMYSTAVGYYATAKSYGSIAVGSANDNTDGPVSTSPAATDRIFQVGNGSNTTRSNAITILRNGNTGIGVLAPQQKLEVNGQIKIMGGSPGTGKVLTSNADGVASWETPAAGITGVSLNQAYNFGGAGVGRTITANTGAVKIDGTDGLLVTGTINGGADIEASGAGSRLFFNPKKAAFRAGVVYANQWDNGNVGTGSFATGNNATASGNYSVAMGELTTASSGGAVAFGYNTRASSFQAVAAGQETWASGSNSFAMGYRSIASGENSVAMGNTDTASNSFTVALGYRSTASGYTAFAAGYQAAAYGNYAVAMGQRATASGTFSFAVGNQATASGSDAIAMGIQAIADQSNAFAAGSGARASGSSAVAIGRNALASGSSSMALGGYQNQATANYAIAMGERAIASNRYSVGIGYYPTASADYAVAIGNYLTSKSVGGTVVGQYNNTSDNPSPTTPDATDRIFQVGNGSSIVYLSNALTVLRNGNVGIGVLAPQQKLEINGQVKITGGSPGAGKVLTSNADGVASWETPAAGITGVTLNQAYNFGGAGTGRTITASTGAVKIDGTDGLLVTGTYNSGADIEASGAGTRLFFNPKKAAFRVGYVDGNRWDNANVGAYSVAMGYNTRASGNHSFAMGDYSHASNTDAVAFGYDSRAFGQYSFAVGLYSSATGEYSVGMGREALAAANGSVAIGGVDNVATATNAVALGGISNRATANESVAMGNGSMAEGNTAIAMGNAARAAGTNSIAIGANTRAWGNDAVSLGANNQANGAYSMAMGYSSTASGDNATTTGYNNQASGPNSIVMGHTSIASGQSAMASGHFVEAKSYGGATLGAYNNLTDAPNGTVAAATDRLFQLGNGTANNARSNAVTVLRNGRTGLTTLTPLATLHVGGTDGLLVTGTYNSGAGIGESGAGTRMFFYPSKAAFRAGEVNGSHWDNGNVGAHSAAMGINNTASNRGSASIGGSNNTASGSFAATIGGSGNNSSHYGSVAMGYNSDASGFASMAMGNYTTAKSYGGMAVGSGNDNSDGPLPNTKDANDRIFQVGNGDWNARSNAITVLRNGNTGVGVLNPAKQKLEVNGSVRQTVYSQTVTIPANSGTNFTWTHNLGYQPIIMISLDHTGGAGYMDYCSFSYGHDNDNTVHIYLTNRGGTEASGTVRWIVVY